jgi:hypothetical protein
VMQFLQLHFQLSIDQHGLPFVVIHVRIKFWGSSALPWRYVGQHACDGKPIPFSGFNPRKQEDQVYMVPIFWFDESTQNIGAYHFLCQSAQSVLWVPPDTGVVASAAGLICGTPHGTTTWCRKETGQVQMFKTKTSPDGSLVQRVFDRVGECDASLADFKDQHSHIWCSP